MKWYEIECIFWVGAFFGASSYMITEDVYISIQVAAAYYLLCLIVIGAVVCLEKGKWL
ncbi:hypothetical protein [Acinetobacter phage AB1I1M-1]